MKRTLIASLMLLASCRHPPVSIPVIELKLPEGEPVRMARNRFDGPTIRLDPAIRLDLNWLDLEGFYPPGTERVDEGILPPAFLVAAERVRFPSMEVARSPDQNHILFHDGLPRGSQIHHWLLLLSAKQEEPRTVYGTARSFDVVWAPNNTLFAITTYSGDNSSEVSVLSTIGERHPIEMRALIRNHLPSYLWDAPTFVKAYRWTADSHLVIRCIGRSTIAPFDAFGCEAVVSFVGHSPIMRFSRGFIKRAHSESSGNAP